VVGGLAESFRPVRQGACRPARRRRAPHGCRASTGFRPRFGQAFGRTGSTSDAASSIPALYPAKLPLRPTRRPSPGARDIAEWPPRAKPPGTPAASGSDRSELYGVCGGAREADQRLAAVQGLAALVGGWRCDLDDHNSAAQASPDGGLPASAYSDRGATPARRHPTATTTATRSHQRARFASGPGGDRRSVGPRLRRTTTDR